MNKPKLSEAIYQQACDFVAQLKQASYEWDISDGEEAANMAAELSHFLDAALREASKQGHDQALGVIAALGHARDQALLNARAAQLEAEAEADYLRDCNDILQVACEVDALRRDKAEVELEWLRKLAEL